MKVQVTNDNGEVSVLVPEPNNTGRHAVFSDALRHLVCPGTVYVVSGCSRVEGKGTAFTTTFSVGDLITIGKTQINVVKIESDSVLFVQEPLTMNMSNAPYGVSGMDFSVTRANV